MCAVPFFYFDNRFCVLETQQEGRVARSGCVLLEDGVHQEPYDCSALLACNRLLTPFRFTPLGFLMDHGDCTRNAA
jgi:hypothetical protein